jgi:hypothetical protein
MCERCWIADATIRPVSANVNPESTAALSEAPWGRVTVMINLSLFLIPAITAWTSTLTAIALIPLIALPVSLSVGAALLVSRAWRRAGGRIIIGTVVAAVLEVALTVALVVAYSSSNPTWDLS